MNVVNQKLSPEQQKLADENRVFELAGCMVDCYVATLTKNNEIFLASIRRVATLLVGDATFMTRFKAARVAVAAEQDRQAKARQVIEPL